METKITYIKWKNDNMEYIIDYKNFNLPSSIEKWNEKGFNMSWNSVWKTIHSPDKSSDPVNLDF